ncbi:MAG TPA: DMT family transporter [Blastococcus sp.]|nr:DMT family transporter [Blastococcus sp.]
MLTVLLALLAAATNAVSSVMQRRANRETADTQVSGLRSITTLVQRPVWLGGMAMALLSFGFGATALRVGQVSKVQLLMSLELPITLVLAARLFRRRLSKLDWAAVLAMTGGMVLLLTSLQPTGGTHQVTAVDWLLGVGVAGAVVAVLLVVGRRKPGTPRAALFGVASGISFALTAVFLSDALAHGLSWGLLARWQTYLVPVAGLGAILILQWAMQAGPLVAVQPGVTLADPIVAVVLGIQLFDERVRTGIWLVPELMAALAVVGGTFLLSRPPVRVIADNLLPPAGRCPAVPPSDNAGTYRHAGRTPRGLVDERQ